MCLIQTVTLWHMSESTLWLIKCFDHHIQDSGKQVQMKQLEHMVEARSSAHLFPSC